jgi:hypothetical protein
METFKELDVDIFQVLGLFPNLLPRDLKNKLNYPLDIPDISTPYILILLKTKMDLRLIKLLKH